MRVHDLQTGQLIPIRSIPIISSRHFQSGQLLVDEKNPTRAGLRVFLSPAGKTCWQEARFYHGTDNLVLCMDGLFVGRVDLTQNGQQPNYHDYPPLWSKEQAQRILEKIPKNAQVIPH